MGSVDPPLALERQVACDWPPGRWLPFRTVVAVSGGPDSTALAVALCRLAQQWGTHPPLVLVHVHHGWRAEQADDDQRAVERLAERLGVPCLVKRCLPPTGGHGLGWEALARHDRYRLLLEAARDVSARYVATAHTRQDQIETVLGRILRGTGIEGLTGIPRLRPLDEQVTLVRPLLAVSRAQVLAYLHHLGYSWQDDVTNLQPRFLRGYLRSELLPVIRQRFGTHAENALWRLAHQARQWCHTLAPLVEQYRSLHLLDEQAERVTFNRAGLAQLRPTLRRLVLRNQWRRQRWPEQRMTYHHWTRMARAVTSPSIQTFTLPGGICCEVTSDVFRLTRSSS